VYNLDKLIDDDDAFRRFTRAVENPDIEPSIRCAKIKLTPRCNLQCSMCTYWRTDRGAELDTQAVLKVLEDLGEMGCMKVHFSGGEIFLREDILDILAKARELRFKVNVTTNGTLITKALASKLMRLRLNSITFSLDGPRQAVHDYIRGIRGAFRKTVEGLERIAAAKAERGGKTKIRINTVIQRDNYRDIPGIFALAARVGAHEVHLMPVDAKKADRKSLSKSQINEYNDTIVPEIINEAGIHGFPLPKSLTHPFGRKKAEINLAKEGKYALDFYADRICYAPWLHTFIAWDGSVSLCCMSRGKSPSPGSVLSESIGAIFRGEAYRQARASMISARPECCQFCDDFIEENRKLDSSMKALISRKAADRL
jgi:MoaA/NifB/PqqE/SkfB family radical SAM enzyme